MAGFQLINALEIIIASDKYKCSDEILLYCSNIGNSIFYRPPKDKLVYADNARKSFHEGNVGDHIALLNIYTSWKDTGFDSEWCYDNYIQFRSMKRARDIRDQLQGLLERVEIQISSNSQDFDAIKKAITSGFFLHSARLYNNGLPSSSLYRTVKHPHTVHIHPTSGLAKEFLPRWVIYNELVLTSKEYMRQVTQVKPEWLNEIAPHYYQLKKVRKKIDEGLSRTWEVRVIWHSSDTKGVPQIEVTFEVDVNGILHVTAE
ncbi:hypothetical protein Leryth_020458 [Lithospermum erythrorhizon]|nr:hypothetical protein Leryth_020458 [Lithospermum erythrorhizon]